MGSAASVASRPDRINHLAQSGLELGGASVIVRFPEVGAAGPELQLLFEWTLGSRFWHDEPVVWLSSPEAISHWFAGRAIPPAAESEPEEEVAPGVAGHG